MLAKNKKGFSLIEILIAITLITMLAAIVIIAVNPGRQFAQGRNTQRWVSVNSILNAVHQNMVDNDGNFDFSGCGATSMPSVATNIDSATGVDLCGCIVPTYIAEMTYDPTDGSYTDCASYDTAYEIIQDATTARITVSAPSAELTQAISVTR